MLCTYGDHIFQTKIWSASSENLGRLFEINSTLKNTCLFLCALHLLTIQYWLLLIIER